MSLKTERHGASQRNGLTPGGKTNRSMTNLASKAMTVKKSVAGQSLQTDADNFVTNSEYPFVKPGDRVDGLKKFQSGGNKGLTIDNDYDLKTKSTNKAPYSRPPSKFAGDYKVFQAVEKTNVSPPTKMKATRTAGKLEKSKVGTPSSKKGKLEKSKVGTPKDSPAGKLKKSKVGTLRDTPSKKAKMATGVKKGKPTAKAIVIDMTKKKINRESGASMREMDPPAKIKEIKAFIKKNMNKMSDSKLSQAIRKKSDNKTEYNWNNKSGKVEAHTKKKTK